MPLLTTIFEKTFDLSHFRISMDAHRLSPLRRRPMKLKNRVCFTLIAVLTSIAPSAAQTFSVLHAFTGTGDGANPVAGVTLRGDALFGTTYWTTIRAGN